MATTYLITSRATWPFSADVHEEARGDVLVRFVWGFGHHVVNIIKPGGRFPVSGSPVDTNDLSNRAARRAFERAALDSIERLTRHGAL